MKILRVALSGAAFAALFAALPAAAQTATTTFQVSASVAKNCTISATNVAITTVAAPWDPTGPDPLPATGTISVRCTRGTVYTVNVGDGTYARTMTSAGGDTLSYNLLAAPGCATPFVPITATAPSRAVQNHSFCAAVDTTADPVAGDYSETVNATVQF